MGYSFLENMQRRPFLKKISLIATVTSVFPFSLISKTKTNMEPKFKFIVASDGHYGQRDTAFESSHRQLIDAIHQEKDVDLVVFNGDLIHDEPVFMPQVKKVYDTLRIPYYTVKGNHDQVPEEDWAAIWGIPANHAFVQGSEFGFVLANSSNQKGEYLCVDTVWLASRLMEFKALPFVFIFIHISQQDWTRHGIACEEVMALIGSYPNVRATFHGHDHDVDGIMYHHKKPYLWSGHFGGSWGSPNPGYRICEVSEDGTVTTILKSMKDGGILSTHVL